MIWHTWFPGRFSWYDEGDEFHHEFVRSRIVRFVLDTQTKHATRVPSQAAEPLSDAEVAERMVKILAMDPVERVRMSFPRNTEEEATK